MNQTGYYIALDLYRTIRIFANFLIRYFANILGSEIIGNLNIKTKMFDFEERVLIGWLANRVREPANQDTYLKVLHFCFYVNRLSIISDPIIVNFNTQRT